MNKFINITIIFITFVFLFSCTQKKVYNQNGRTEAVKKMHEKTENIDENKNENENNSFSNENLNDITELNQLKSNAGQTVMFNIIKTKNNDFKFEVQYTEKNSKLKQPVIKFGDSLKITVGNNDSFFILTAIQVEKPISLDAGGEKIFTTKAYYKATKEQIQNIGLLNVPVKINLTIQRNKKAEIVNAFFSPENIASFKKFSDNYLK